MDNPRILIIDDDPNLRKTLADILVFKGFEPVAAGSGVDGLVLLRENPADIALIDLDLPDISGVEVLTRIKADHPSTEVIILTGKATLDSAIEATNRGAFSYLQKPYDINQLLLHIQRAHEKQQTQEQIIQQNIELQNINKELKILHEVSLAINQTIDLDKLLSDVLAALDKMKIFEFELKGAIFLVEEETLRLASVITVPETILEPCKKALRGECLCGFSVATGEIIVSKKTARSECGIRCDSAILPHGRIIVPLMSACKAVGVLTIYARTDVELDSQMLMLLSSIGNQLGIAINNARLYEETKAFSLHDPLTGLANRRFMEAQLIKEIDSVRRYSEKLSIIMLDIDHFKKYNDTHGHLAGDQLLVKLANILTREVRSADHVFRYGGEEFLAILPRADLASAREVAERLRTAVESEIGVTISLGVVSCSKYIQNKETLLGQADDALYRAKQNGRNRVEVAFDLFEGHRQENSREDDAGLNSFSKDALMNNIIKFLTIFLLMTSAFSYAMDTAEYSREFNQCGINKFDLIQSRILIVYADGTTVAVSSLNCAVAELEKNKNKLVDSLKAAEYLTKELLDAKSATWVIGGKNKGIMTPLAKRAFATSEGARRFVEQNGGIVISFDQAMNSATREVMDQAAQERAMESEILRELQ